MSLVLISREKESQTLMHYRTKGSKNGVRQYQNEDGSLTPLGRIHYGVGKARDSALGEHIAKRVSTSPAQKTEVKARAALVKAERLRAKADKSEARSEHLKTKAEKQKNVKEPSDSEIANKVKDKINQFNASIKKRNELRKEKAAKLKEKKSEDRANGRDMSDKDLNEKIDRLQREKRYADLLAERKNREQGELAVVSRKLLKEAAENLARKSLNSVVDKLVSKTNKKESFKLSDYKDVDPYSLDSEKLAAVSTAFNNAAMLLRNRKAVNNGGTFTHGITGGTTMSDSYGLILCNAEDAYLMHYRTPGSKNGVRLYQNKDGSLTALGKEHYSMMYGWNSKKLDRLEKKADVDYQKSQAEKYGARAGKVKEVAKGLTKSAVGTFAGSAAAVAGLSGVGRRGFSKQISYMTKHYDAKSKGKIAEAGYYHMMNGVLGKQLENLDKFTDLVANTGTVAVAGFGAAAVGAAGYFAYNKARENISKRRISDIGHSKAVKKYEKQYNKMVEMFKGTPYSDLVNNRKKTVT